MYRFHWRRREGQFLSCPDASSVFVHPRVETVEEWPERNVRTSFQTQQQPCLYVEGRARRWRKVSVRGSRRLWEVEAAGLSRLNSAAEIGGLPTLAGPVDTVPAVVGSRLCHAALPASSYDTCD